MSFNLRGRRVRRRTSCGSAALTFLALWCLATGAHAQAPSAASPGGACTPERANGGATFTITCGISAEQGAEILRIVNRILSGQMRADDVMAKLDEIRPADPNVPRISYTYRGVQRVVTGGVTTTGTEDAVTRYVEMVKALQSGAWDALRDAAEEQIEERPDWFTPYLFSGIAHLARGESAMAIERLEYAERGIAGNPDYDGIRELVARTLAQARTATP